MPNRRKPSPEFIAFHERLVGLIDDVEDSMFHGRRPFLTALKVCQHTVVNIFPRHFDKVSMKTRPYERPRDFDPIP
jgi:hypothetical protein